MADLRCRHCKGHLADGVPLEPTRPGLLVRLLRWRKHRRIRDEYLELAESWSLQCSRRIRDEAGEIQPDKGISLEPSGSALRTSRELVVERHKHLLNSHAERVKTFMNKAERAVQVDEYGDEVRDFVEEEIDKFIYKILEKENSDPELDYSIEFLARCYPEMTSCYSYWWLHDELHQRFVAHPRMPKDSAPLQADKVDQMSGVEFENWLIDLIRSIGVDQVVPTKGSGDQGADVIVRHRDKTLVIQAKRYSQRVGNDSVQQAHAAKAVYNAQEAWVVTNSAFTKLARQAATHTGVRLIEGFQLRNIGALVARSMAIKISDEAPSGRPSQP